MTDYYGNIMTYQSGDEVIMSKEDFELISEELVGSGIHIKNKEVGDLDFFRDDDATLFIYKQNDSSYNYIKYDYYANIEHKYFDLKKDFEALKKVYSDSVARYEELTGDYSKLENEYDVLSKRYDKLDRAYNRLEKERYDLKNEVNKLSGDLLEDELRQCSEELDKKITKVSYSDENKANKTSKEVKKDTLSFNEWLWKWETR
jgi:uncharacterized protein YdcH (DUF465 family)